MRTRTLIKMCPAPFLALLCALGGCAQLPPVQAWEKGALARPEMGFDSDRLDAAFTEHVYASKEGAAGGSGATGGGCGCN